MHLQAVRESATRCTCWRRGRVPRAARVAPGPRLGRAGLRIRDRGEGTTDPAMVRSLDRCLLRGPPGVARGGPATSHPAGQGPARGVEDASTATALRPSPVAQPRGPENSQTPRRAEERARAAWEPQTHKLSDRGVNWAVRGATAQRARQRLAWFFLLVAVARTGLGGDRPPASPVFRSGSGRALAPPPKPCLRLVGSCGRWAGSPPHGDGQRNSSDKVDSSGSDSNSSSSASYSSSNATHSTAPARAPPPQAPRDERREVLRLRLRCRGRHGLRPQRAALG